MKKSHAMKWINALRSGKYKQTKNYLRNSQGYCCLGVANEIFPELDLAKDGDVSLDNFARLGLACSSGFLCKKDDAPTALQNSAWDVHLATLNDDGYTFDEIADVIQIEYVEGL